MVKKRSSKKPGKIKIPAEIESMPVDLASESVASDPENMPKVKSGSKAGIIIILVILAGILIFRNGWVLSAVVNGNPIFSWQLYGLLNERYGKQTLEGLVTEKLISSEAAKSGIQTTPEDIKNREEEMLKSFGGNVTLEEVLQFQGMSKSSFESQLKLQLSVEKLLSKDISFTETQIDNYLATSSGRLTATDAAGLRAEARQVLTQDELEKRITPWLNDLREKAKVIRF